MTFVKFGLLFVSVKSVTVWLSLVKFDQVWYKFGKALHKPVKFD